MVSADDLYKMHHRLTDIFNKPFPPDGIGMMFVGDMLQLQPVKGRLIFEVPKDQAHPSHFEEKSLLGSKLIFDLKKKDLKLENSLLIRFKITSF